MFIFTDGGVSGLMFGKVSGRQTSSFAVFTLFFRAEQQKTLHFWLLTPDFSLTLSR